MKHRALFFTTLALLTAVIAPSAAADGLRLPAILGDHMVLQRGAGAPVWGWAEPGAEVTVRFKGQSVKAVADEVGRWRVELEPMEADGEPAAMTVASGGETLSVGDVLVGDVWLCSGQSNMEWPVERAADAEREIANADWPLIRHIKAARNPQMQPQEDNDTSWTVCSPQTVAGYTAVGYYFGRKLHRELGVPIGLLNCTWGGTRIEPWTPIEGLAATAELDGLYRSVLVKLPGSAAYKRRAGAYLDAMSEWLTQAKQRLTADKPIREPAAYPEVLKPFTGRHDPTALYNGMVAPFVPFAIRGAIWYQGEANRYDGMAYLDKTRALVEGWRTVWDDDSLPYYFVQIAPFEYGHDNPYVLPELWEAQAAAAETIPHTGMVVVHDIGNIANIHPTNKQDVGLRLANMALKREYGYSDLLDTGPRFREMTVEGEAVRVRFDHVADGLATRDGQPPNHFELAGRSEPWASATARIISPDTLELTAPGIDQPVAVRMGWHKTAEPNLMNSAGLPAAPFRAGEPVDFGSMSRNVPEADEYEVIYELDLMNLGNNVRYSIDRRRTFYKPFDRVAYYLELKDAQGQTRWVFVSMDAFTDDLGKIGVPTADSGAHFQQIVGNVSVRSSVASLPQRDGLSGNIEFWPNNYGRTNSADVPGAVSDAFDTGDEPSNPVDGYGSMQVHLLDPSVTVFALNHWSEGDDADLGIGSNDGQGEPDWTFTRSANRYSAKRLKVLVRLAP